VSARVASRRLQRQILAALTPREHDVLNGIAEGKSNKSIARHFGISPRTVEAHRAKMMSKSGAHSVSDLVRLAACAERLH
jgi:two-component system response regulator FixJ